ncbi:UDP-N-acetylmuramoyl-tripeptide--D-alanyl-D-alanine ligase [Aestuariivivens sediminicola]|uniref:UDP-N-acetylmuramoyl-tripeptide--D-alanyl-D- alanine ligase n=1 Tax=Aestuariivivens sediminicola TaxID=2913560 RepID=UPI001F571CD1|nr:UDP-N-acetylmuramoyl-tripeptide--D-alanyl-D-alanine ligase [Aestuariivivens sediminicola]
MNSKQLHQLFLTCHSANTDTRKIVKNDMFFALKGANFNGNAFAKKALELGAKYAIIDEPDFVLNEQTILVQDVLKTLQDLATYHRHYLNIPIIALTGSNGKTTTKELISAILSKKYSTTATTGNLNNHIGVPLTLLSMTQDTQIGVVEMGANHQKEIQFLCQIAHPDYGYITNFGKAHLEGFGGVEGVIKGKSELYDYLIAHKKTIFVNGNDPIQVEKTKHADTFSFGTSGHNVNVTLIEANPFVHLKYDALIIKSQLIGAYNFDNIAAAIAIGHYFKIDAHDIRMGIENYVPNNNRSQIVTKGKTKIILDAYNANPTSMRAALVSFKKQKGKKIAILGDMFELGDYAREEHQMIADFTASLNFHDTILVGKNFYNCKTDSKSIKQFKSFDDFKANYNWSDKSDAIILIKGSRGMALERVLELESF